MLESEITTIRNATADELINMFWCDMLNSTEKLNYAFEMLVWHYERLKRVVDNDFNAWEDCA